MFKHTAAIGADIGRHILKIAVVKIGGEFIAVKSYPLKQKQSKKYLLSKLFEAISDIRQTVAAEEVNPICIGVSAKGFIDHKYGIILGPDRGIKDWENVPLAKILNQETGLPAYVGNDANMMTIAEHRFGAAKGFDNVIFVSLRTGIGGGIIINGKLYRGVNNAGGEMGQMIINFDNGLNDKGIVGSFEHYASATAVVRRYYEETGKVYDSKKGLTCKDIFELSYKNDSAAVKVVNENSKIVGIGLANLISIFAPEIIVVGGGMSEARDSYFEMIKKSAFENSLENCRAEVKIERANLGASGSLIGSAYFGMTRLAGRNI
ncbi:MAG TPA: ROK family protein [Bacteroidales bacterium]|nr:ROK family protein [Bacteroidales bacterium]HPT20802.1 ROK family protein [Bacteroidales bacterium]